MTPPDCATAAPHRSVRARSVASYTHPPQDSTEQAADPRPGSYYVSVQDGARFALLLGPFRDNHAGALAMVDKVRAAACEQDARAHWYAFGTCRMDPTPDTEPGPRCGSLNAAMGYSTTARDISG